MNFMSYVAEISRRWDEPNARDMGRMTSQHNTKGEMYILNDGIDMKAKIATMARRLEELEMKKMQKRDHPNFSWEPQPPQYQQPAQAPQQASNLDQAMVNLSKVVGDFVGAQKSINAHLSQRIDSVESSLNKRMDEVQSDLSQKIDNYQYSISRFANLNKVQEKGNFPSQHYQNSKGIHEVEAQKGESSMVKEVKTVITLRSGKEVDLPTSKLEHRGKTGVCEISQPKRSLCEIGPLLRNHFPAPRSRWENTTLLQNDFPAPYPPSAKPPLGTRVPFRSTVTPFRSCEMAAKSPKREISNFRSHSPILQPRTLISQLQNGCETSMP
ncbi:hypothetical protein CK203_093630 [Vitis vinifera]|uniref:Uncharacterized protein n=1 Tax=Vitis vinifera TaxID=29760 RepID=A0A438CIG1_VITVI|nr:hypothetical protein CK203_093630 [Vitis vinifera]